METHTTTNIWPSHITSVLQQWLSSEGGTMLKLVLVFRNSEEGGSYWQKMFHDLIDAWNWIPLTTQGDLIWQINTLDWWSFRGFWNILFFTLPRWPAGFSHVLVAQPTKWFLKSRMFNQLLDHCKMWYFILFQMKFIIPPQAQMVQGLHYKNTYKSSFCYHVRSLLRL